MVPRDQQLADRIVENIERPGRRVDDVLFFAGEATAPDDWNATVDGAIRSGRRAAEEITAAWGLASPAPA